MKVVYSTLLCALLGLVSLSSIAAEPIGDILNDLVLLALAVAIGPHAIPAALTVVVEITTKDVGGIPVAFLAVLTLVPIPVTVDLTLAIPMAEFTLRAITVGIPVLAPIPWLVVIMVMPGKVTEEITPVAVTMAMVVKVMAMAKATVGIIKAATMLMGELAVPNIDHRDSALTNS
ncbi:hypothetical protein IWQ61_006459 [Dispira simplex]|nr:hypothetical protein IWQ61_006459 [Dispira simplex]